MSTPHVPVPTLERHAAQLLDLLVDAGPLTREQCCDKLGWTSGRFSVAVRYARSVLGPALGVAIPAATPQRGWHYEVTTEWQPVEEGSSYVLGLVETRLRSIHRDVRVILPHLSRGTKEWRRASFLDKHLGHLTGTLAEIDGTEE